MSDPARSLAQPPPGEERSKLSLEELEKLPADSPELAKLLPAWVTEAHLKWLETGEGDPWGGYFS
jgi:hypothetical protein